MAVRIRLSRTGKNKTALYRVVVADKEAPRDGKVIEFLGHYNPKAKETVLKINKERLEYWMSKGAKCSDTVRTLIKNVQSK